MSEDKVRRKDWCWSVRAVYVLGKLSDVSGPGLEEAGHYTGWLICRCPLPPDLLLHENLLLVLVTSRLLEARPAYIWKLS